MKALRASVILLISAALFLLLFSCAEKEPLEPKVAQLGELDFSRYLALGNSLTAGFLSGGLVETYQKISFPALIARQAGVPEDQFQQPLISEPGIPPLLELQSYPPNLDISPKSATPGQPTNLTYAGIYNNLAIPGATVHDLVATTTSATNPFFDIVLRGQGTAIQQAVAFNPTFVTLWIGSNDVLGAAMMGGEVPPTPTANFQSDYQQIIEALTTQTTAKIVVANVPDVTVIPFFVTIPPVVLNPMTGEPILDPAGNPIPLIGEDAGPGPLDPRTLVSLLAMDSLKAGVGIPREIGGTGRPLPGIYTLTPEEVQTLQTAVAEFNAAIAQIAQAKGIPVLDANALLKDIAAHGYDVGGILVTIDFLVGGFFSLDGVHPSALGYAIAANEFIKLINTTFGSDIPPVDLGGYLKGLAKAADRKINIFDLDSQVFHQVARLITGRDI